MHAFQLSMRGQGQVGLWEFEANQKYIVGATQRVRPREREGGRYGQTDRQIETQPYKYYWLIIFSHLIPKGRP